MRSRSDRRISAGRGTKSPGTSTTRSSGWRSRPSPRATPSRSQAVSCSASSSLASSPWTPTSCCSTSRPQSSIPRAPARCGACFGCWREKARRSSSRRASSAPCPTWRTALCDVSFEVAAGERVALLGRNGAGKTTLVRLVAGLLHPDAGTVWVGDWDTGERAPEQLARRVGSLFQHADQQLFARTVREDVGFGPRALGFPAHEVSRRTEEALEALALGGHATQHPYDLPPALRKLAALAGTLALEPMLLV